ncbi:MAG: hypothetical protein AB1384_12325 [Actinomycetota bacterium]
MTYCQWCKETLHYIRGKGWVHEDGNTYVTRKEWNEVLGRFDEVDDHCALPVFEEAWDSTLDMEMEDRLCGGGFELDDEG